MREKLLLSIALVLCFGFVVASVDYTAQGYYTNSQDTVYSSKADIITGAMSDVDPYTGSFSYQYPIKIPEGTNGLKPNIFLNYNSHNAYGMPGILGSGWSLSESYIERDTNYSFSDSSDDQFRLVLEGASYDLIYVSSENRFHTKRESYLYVANETNGNNTNDKYFVVKKKDGSTYRFGYSNNSEQISNIETYTTRWNLDLVSDVNNNSIFYTYQENPSGSTGFSFLQKIEYNNDKERVIEFSLESSDRSDDWEIYKEGNKISLKKRLNEIIIKVNESMITKYSFNYTTLDNFQALSFLVAINEHGSDNSTFATTGFEYAGAEAGWTSNSTWNSAVFFKNGYSSDAGGRIFDANRDGLADLFVGVGEGSCEDDDVLKTYLNNKNGWTYTSSQYGSPLFIDSGGNDYWGYRFADVNGDGLADKLYGRSGAGSGTAINDGSGWGDSWMAPPYSFLTSSGYDNGVRLVDVNGDGLADIIRSYYTGTNGAKINNGTHWVTDAAWNSPVTFTTSYGDNGVRLVDVNGDGLVDILRAYSGSKSAWINTGDGWTQDNSWNVPTNFRNDYSDDGARFIDLNGDGLVDILKSMGGSYSAWINTGDGWTQDNSWAYSSRDFFNWNSRAYDYKAQFADVNGDGLTDVLFREYGAGSFCSPEAITTITHTKKGKANYLLRNITTSMGGKIYIDYMQSTSLDNTGNDSVSDLGFNLWMVSNLTRENGMAGAQKVVFSTIYDYSGGMHDYIDREFRGFNFAEEETNGRIIRHWFYQDDAKRGKEYRTEILNESEYLFQKQELAWNSTENDGYYIVLLLEESEVLYGESGSKVRNNSYSYDEFGNVIEIHHEGDVDDPEDNYYEYFSYVNNSDAWIIGSLSNHSVFDSILMNQTLYSYDDLGYGVAPVKGSVTSKEEWLSGGSPIVNYSYNSFGNLVNETDALGNVVEYEYDSSYTFVDKMINANGFVTEYEYDLGIGKPLWVRDSNGNYLNYSYDVFGRPSMEIMVYDSVAYPTKSYSYAFDGVAPESVRISIREENGSAETFDEYQFFDGFNKIVQIKKDGADERQIVTDMYYNAFGKMENTSNPYFTDFDENYSNPNSSIKVVSYEYDILGRIVLIVNPDGSNKTNIYDLWNISYLNENSDRTDHVLDAEGRIVLVREFNDDENYTTFYEYDKLGNLILIRDTLGNNFSFSYDSLGRKISEVDPDLGAMEYKYDANGNLINEVRAHGGVVSDGEFFREYNDLGQVVRIRQGDNSSAPIFEEYVYDYNGERIKSYNYASNTTTYTPFKEFKMVINETGVYNYTYVYADDVLVARINLDGSKWFYHADHLGSTSLITNESGNVVEVTSYLPFGGVMEGGSSDNKLYENKELDETGLYYYGFRYYDPEMRIFVKADSMLPDVYDPQQLNRYMFERGNPFSYTDPSGHILDPVTWGFVGFVLISYTFGALDGALDGGNVGDMYVGAIQNAGNNLGKAATDPEETVKMAAGVLGGGKVSDVLRNAAKILTLKEEYNKLSFDSNNLANNKQDKGSSGGNSENSYDSSFGTCSMFLDSNNAQGSQQKSKNKEDGSK